MKGITRRCTVCKQKNARPNEHFMNTLPSFRIEQGNPHFFRSFVDFFRSIYVKRKRSRVKRWGCIFVYMSVWAVNIEFVELLNTDSFIHATQGFINRWGRTSLIIWDCRKIFKVAVKELEIEKLKLDHNKVRNKISQWKFNRYSIHPFHHTWEGCRKGWFEQSRKLCLLLSRIRSWLIFKCWHYSVKSRII